MEFDLVSFVNLVISSVIGVLSGLAISHYYWTRSEPMDRILKELKRALPHYMHPIRYPQFYSPSAHRATPDEGVPGNPDVPHVDYAIFSNNVIKAGTKFEVLFSIRDTGRNFENPDGLSIRDHRGMPVAPVFCGLGYASATFDATPLASGGPSKISVALKDTSDNKYEQQLSFTITP